jgi:hypothetical protein
MRFPVVVVNTKPLPFHSFPDLSRSWFCVARLRFRASTASDGKTMLRRDFFDFGSPRTVIPRRWTLTVRRWSCPDPPGVHLAALDTLFPHLPS